MTATILVVDDTPENVKAFCNILGSYLSNLELLSAASGAECIGIAKARRPDVILLDVHMPGMDGFEVCRILKSTPETQNISVLMVSALMTAGRHRAAGIDSGADGYLCKPFDSAELIAQVRSLIRLKRYEDELRRQQDHLEETLRDRTLKLQMSEMNWRRLFEEAPVPIYIEDLKGNVLEANNSACELQGMTHTELLTKNATDLVPPEYRQRILELFPGLHTQALKGYESFTLAKNGQVIPVEIHAQQFEYFGAAAILVYVRDLRERLQLEEELTQAQKLESMGLLAGGIAHDFNNILTGVIGNLSMMKMEVSTENSLRQMICDAEESALRAKLLTHQLQTFSKGGAPILKTASLRQLLETSSRFMLTGTRSVCEMEIADDLATVDIDVSQMSQVLENLVINAAQSMPDGGVIRLKAENAVADITLRRRHRNLSSGRIVKISVADRGVGIAAENLTRIFDPYFTTKEAGSGLGLATGYAIVKKHGGAIDVASEVGKGTTFTVYLPASVKEVARPAAEISDVPIRGQGRILVMDDESAILKIMQVALTKLGYEVSTATDGRMALELYQKSLRAGVRFDAVIFDLTVPGKMGGEEAVKLIRAFDPALKAIVSSGYTEGLAISFPERCGFQASIEKPYSVYTLSRVLHKLLADDAGAAALT